MISTLKSNKLSDRARSAIAIFEKHPLPVFFIDPSNFHTVFANIAAVDCYGYTDEEFIHFNFLNLFVEDSRIYFYNQAKAERDILKTNGTYQHCRKDGKIITTELYTMEVVLDETTFYQVTIVDNTEKTVQLASLNEERLRYKEYIEQSSEGIFCQEFKAGFYIQEKFENFLEHSKKTSFISHCNDAMAKMYGYTAASEMKGVPVEQIFNYNDEDNISFLKKFLLNGFRIHNAETHEQDRHGNARYFLTTAIGIIEDDHLVAIWGTQKEITEQKKTEQKIRLLDDLVEQTSDVLIAADLNFNALTWNKGAVQLFGLSAEQVLGKNPSNFTTISYGNCTRDEVREIIKEKAEWRGELSFVRLTDNRQITLFANIKLLKDEQSNPVGHIIAGGDITDINEAVLRLKETEARFTDVADSAPVMIWMTDAANNTTYVNKTWQDFTGINLDELKASGWHNTVHPEDFGLAIRDFNEAFEKRGDFKQVYRARHHSGDFRWIMETCIPRFLEDGSFIGYIGTSVDIDAHKKTEQQLRYNANLLENVSDIIVTTDLNFIVRGWNKVAEKYYAIPEGEAIGRRMNLLANVEYYGTTEMQARIDLQKKGIWNGEISFVNRQGELRHFLYTVKYIDDEQGNRAGVLAIGRNITERKEIEKQLLKSEKFYRTLIADSLGGTALVDATGKVTFISPSVKGILGFDPEEVKSKSAFEFIHPDDFKRAFDSFEEVLQNPHARFIVIRMRQKSGEWKWCMVRAHNLLQNPYINSIVLYFHDDTLRKQAEDALRESEITFRNLISDLPIGVVLLDKNGKTILCNDSFVEIFDNSKEDIVGRSMHELALDPIHEDGSSFQDNDRPMLKALQTKEAARDVVMGCLTPKSKERVWILVNSTPVLDEHGEIVHLVSSVKDITDRKRMEKDRIEKHINHQKQLTQASIDGQENERREIGKELHDSIGQQLTTIKLFLDIAKGSAADENTNKMLDSAIKSVANVINEVRTMSHSLIPSTLNDLGLVESIYELIALMNRTQAIDIEFKHSGFCDSGLKENQQLTLYRIIQEQLNNIVKHADAKHAVIQLIHSGENLVLEISDDGHGFDKKTFRKGVGLMNMKNRAELFGGSFEINSELGQGCHVRISLPVCSGEDGWS